MLSGVFSVTPGSTPDPPPATSLWACTARASTSADAVRRPRLARDFLHEKGWNTPRRVRRAPHGSGRRGARRSGAGVGRTQERRRTSISSVNENTVLYALSTLAQTCAAPAAFAALTRFDQPIRRVSVALITFE